VRYILRPAPGEQHWNGTSAARYRRDADLPEVPLAAEPLRAEPPERDDGAEPRGELVEARPAGAEPLERTVLGGADTGIDRAGARTPAEGAIGTRGCTVRDDAGPSREILLALSISTCSLNVDRLRSLTRLRRSDGGGLAGSLDFGGAASRAGGREGALCTWLRGLAGSPPPRDWGTDSRGCRSTDDGGLEPREPGAERTVPPDWPPVGGALITRCRGCPEVGAPPVPEDAVPGRTTLQRSTG
jgi:hypothetical protein